MARESRDAPRAALCGFCDKAINLEKGRLTERRAARPDLGMAVYGFADIVVDKDRMQVVRDGNSLELEPKSLRVLLYLIEHRERVVGKEELIAEVWGGTFVTDNAVTRVIAQIRKHLGDSARAPRYIETVATSGYRFIATLHATEFAPPAQQAAWSSRWRPAAVLLALTGSAALLWGIWRLPENGPVGLSRIQQLTTSAAADLWPAFSPDGSQLAYSSNRNGHFEIYARSLTSGVERQVTSGWEDYIQPSFSPDGQYLVFVEKVRGGIEVIPTAGGAVRHLADSGIDPHWSPDGRSLVYRSGGLNAVREPSSWDTHLMLVDVDGSPPRALTHPGAPRGGHNFPRWLPGGRQVVFTAPTESSSSAPWIVDVRTGDARPVPVSLGFMQFPAFDADARYLYFVGSGREEVIGLWRARLDRNWRPRNPESVMPTSGQLIRDLAVSPDASRIAYSQESGQSAIWSVPLGAGGRAAGDPHPLIHDNSFRNTGPSFSIDGARLAYSSVRQGGNWTIMVANADGTAISPVMSTERANSVPAWLANDLMVGFQAFRKGQGGYWISTPEGPPRRLDLKLDLRRADNLQVSRDGSKVVAHIATPAGAKIVMEDLTQGTVRDLTPIERNISFGCWSPDGRWIAAQERIRGRSTLVLVSVETGDIRTLVDVPGHSWAHDWSPDGDRIVFAGLRDGVWNIYWVSRSTSHVEQLTRFTSQSAFVRYPAWSPGNDQVAFEYNELAANIYLADLK